MLLKFYLLQLVDFYIHFEIIAELMKVEGLFFFKYFSNEAIIIVLLVNLEA